MTLLSKDIFKVINKDSSFKLEDVPFQIGLADGQELEVLGQFTCMLGFGKNLLTHTLIVADIKSEGILGMDFMMNHDCKIDMSTSEMILDGQKILTNVDGDIEVQCCRMANISDVGLGPYEQAIVQAKASKRGKLAQNMMIEGSALLAERDSILVARSLVDATQNTIPVRVFNVSDEEVLLRKGTTLAIGHPVTDVIELGLEQKIINQINRKAGPTKRAEMEGHLHDLLVRSSKDLSEQQTEQLKELLLEYHEIFVDGKGIIGRTSLVKHKIDTGNAVPIRQRPRPIPIHLREEVDLAMEDMITKDLIEPSDSPWCSPIVLIRKKDKSLRTCIDFRKVNDVSRKDSYNVPSIQTSLDHLSGAKYFSTLDLASGYNQIEMDPADKEKTAFSTGRHGLYQYKVLPFGLANGTATFQRLMETIFTGLQWKELILYIDDIISYSTNFEEGLDRLGVVFQKLKEAGLTLKSKKCILFQRKVQFLGHVVSEEGISTDPEKISAIKEWPVPTSVTQLRSFVGICAYYRRFIGSFSEIAKPLHKLTEKEAKFIWDEKCQAAFTELKERLTSTPVLAYPNTEDPFILDTDASDVAMGAVLSQVQESQERVVAYGSKTFSKSEINYCVTRKELCSVVHFVKHFRHYLLGQKFLVRTDHGSLRWLINFRNPDGQMARWLEILAPYDFEIQHRPGKKHKNADALSRIPCKQCGRHAREVLIQSLTTESPENRKWLEYWNINDIKKWQSEDPVLREVVKWKNESAQRPAREKISIEGPEIKFYWSRWDHLVLETGCLYYLWEEGEGNKTKKLVASERLKDEILKQLHDSLTAGHLGEKKTYDRVKEQFFWYKYREFVEKWCKQCDFCAARKVSAKKRVAPMQRFLSGCPFERISIDILGPLPKSRRGNQYILVLADHLTKWTEAIPNAQPGS